MKRRLSSYRKRIDPPSDLIGCRFTVGATMLAMALGLFACSKPLPPVGKVAPPVPTISPTGDALTVESWRAAKAAHDAGVSADGQHSYAHVIYKPTVRIVDETAVATALLGVSADGHVAVFHGAPPEILALKPGDVFMVKKRFAVNVLGIATENLETVIIVDRVSLSDVIQSGEIHLDTAVGFHGLAVTQTRSLPAHPFEWLDVLATPAYAQTGAKQDTTLYPGPIEGMIPSYYHPPAGINGGSATEQAKKFASALTINDWKIENWSVTPVGNSANISARMSKDVAGFVAVIGMEGTISNFEFAQNLTFPLNSSQLIAGVRGLSGSMKFSWEIGKETPGEWTTEDRLNLPTGLSIELSPMLEGLPLTLEISSALVVHPELTGGSEYAKGEFTIGWKADSGSEGLTFEITDDKSVSPVAPNGMVVSFCVPRIELELKPLAAFATLSKYAAKIPAPKTIAAIISRLTKAAASNIAPTLLQAIQKSPIGDASLSDILESKADVYVQIIHSDGTTHAANISLVPCSKVELTVTGQSGASASAFGLSSGESHVTDLFTKTFTRWNPGSDFCKSI